MKFSRFFILRPIATSLFMISILITGMLAYRALPLSALPDVDYPTIQLTTFYPGASAQTVANTITAPLERQLGQIPSLQQMHSNSTQGASSITLTFGLNIDIDVAEQQVQAALNNASTFLPQDLPMPPVYNKINPADAPILTLAITSTQISTSALYELVDTRLAMKLSQVSGVGLVSIAGSQRPAIRIQINPLQLAASGLSLEDVKTLISKHNVSMSKGSFNGDLRATSLDTNDQLRSPVDYQQLILSQNNGQLLRLGDVADIVEDSENTQRAAWSDGQPAILLNIQRQPSSNVIAVSKRVKETLAQLHDQFPAHVTIRVTTDRTQGILSSLEATQQDLLIAIGLVVLVIFLFLKHIRTTLIPSLAIPLSLLGTLSVLVFMGFSINNLTLMAMVIATGFVVDDAIVMIENIMRHREMGKDGITAAIDGAHEITGTIISLSLALVAVLIPLLFMQDLLGRLFHEFAYTLGIAIIISALASLTLTPMLSAKLLPPSHTNTNTDFFTHIQQIYMRLLGWILARQPQALVVTIGLFLCTIAMTIVIPKGFFPVQDTGMIMGITDAPTSASFRYLADQQQALSERLMTHPDVDNITAFVGVDGINSSPNTGRLQIQLKPMEQRQHAIDNIMASLQTIGNDQSPLQLHLQLAQDLTVDSHVARTQYQLMLSTPDSALLSEWTHRITTTLSELPILMNVSNDLQQTGLQTLVNIDRDAAARLGVSIRDVDQALLNAFGQRMISTIFTQSNQYRVILETKPEFRRTPDDLNNVYVTNSNHQSIALSRIARFVTQVAPLTLQRLDQFPASTISFDLASGISLGDAMTQIHQITDAQDMPSSIDMRFLGATEAFQKTLNNSVFLSIAAVITVYILLGMLYESFIHPLTIISTLPTAAIGALLSLYIIHSPLDMISFIGIILLIGIVMKNAIMMIDFALNAMRQQLLPAQEAITLACQLRLRPILMTTFAALLGALPLILSGGLGTELRQPMGVVLVGGLIFSQILTLFTTPVIFLALEKFTLSRAIIAQPLH